MRERSVESIPNALSFDLEEWFHAEVFASLFPRERWGELESRSEAQADRVLALLATAGVKATFFILGWIAERKPALVKRIAAEGHEIGCHGYSHTMITMQSRAEFQEDAKTAKTVLEELSGKNVRGYRAPTFSVTRETLWALELLWEMGFAYDSSIYPIRHDRYGIPGSPRVPYIAVEREGRALWEFPGATIRIAGITLPAAGGGYLRLFPYSWTRAAIRAMNRRGRPANIFAHPWEFDLELPRVDLPLLSLRQTAGWPEYGLHSGQGHPVRDQLQQRRYSRKVKRCIPT